MMMIKINSSSLTTPETLCVFSSFLEIGMTNNITVEFLNDDGVVVEVKKFNSVTELSRAYPQYEYQQLRQVYLFTNNKSPTKKLQSNAKLLNVMKIYDTDNYSKGLGHIV